MSIIRADISDIETVKYITTETINSIYPHYYPEGAVDFFLGHHNDKNIENMYYYDLNQVVWGLSVNNNMKVYQKII